MVIKTSDSKKWGKSQGNPVSSMVNNTFSAHFAHKVPIIS